MRLYDVMSGVRLKSTFPEGEKDSNVVILFRHRALAMSTTARWSRRVGWTDRPEFRLYFFGKLREVQVPDAYWTMKRQYFYHVVQGYLPIFKIPRFPRGDLPSLHTLDGTRTERAA